MYISGFSDEIDKNIDIQFSVLNKLGIRFFEPRGINGKNISLLTLDEAKELKGKMDKAGIKASSIGSPIGKADIKDTDKDFELFKHIVEIAKILECRFIRMFSFYNAHSSKDAVISALKRMTDYAEKENVILLHENEKDIYGDTAQRCLEILDAVNSENFKAVFDPANFVQCGEDTKKAYEMLKNHIAYMHIKDSREDKTIVPAGAGAGNVKYILDELKKDGYKGFLSLEPHLGTFDGLADLEVDDSMLKLEKSGEGTFTLAYNSLKILLEA